MRQRPDRVGWTELVARAAALLLLVCAGHACTGPGLEPPESQGAAGAAAGGASGTQSTGGSAGVGGRSGAGGAGAGAGGFSPTGGSGAVGGEDGLDAGEAEMDSSVDDDDGGVDPTND